MSKIYLLLATTISASFAFADNSSCSENVRMQISSAESTLVSGPSVPLAQRKTAADIIKLIKDLKEKRVSDCKIVDQVILLLPQNR